MGAYNLKRFSRPQVLRTIERQFLLQLLDPYRAFFLGRGRFGPLFEFLAQAFGRFFDLLGDVHRIGVGIACGRPFIGVDIHVHRVTNRWGYVATATPEKTMAALAVKLPRRYWVEINALLVPFGKHVCTGVRPKCSTCPVLEMCRQVGVTSHR